MHTTQGRETVRSNLSLDLCKQNAFTSSTVGCGKQTSWIQRIFFFELSRTKICSIAQAACSAIKGSESSAPSRKAGKFLPVPTFPSATHTFRKNPRRLIRLIGEFRNKLRNSVSLSAR